MPRARPNRRRVVSAKKPIREMRETFSHRPVERVVEMDFDYPAELQLVGASLAVAYESDKWEERGANGRRKMELWKHLTEKPQRCLAVPGILRDYEDTRAEWPTTGPTIDIDQPMSREIAYLGLFEELCLRLYTRGTDDDPKFGRRKDEGVVHVSLRHAHVGGVLIMWSEIDRHMRDEPVLIVYTERDGILFMVLGDQLDIERDGIVG